jgi:Rad3-related DNA helicase
MTPEQMTFWVLRADQIIRGRLDRKGIFHTVSFRRRDLVTRESEFASIMLSNSSYRVQGSSATTARIVEQFKAASPPRVLVSPSLSTGYDFPYRECEYQIIGKIPFPDTQGRIMKVRHQQDPGYTSYIAIQELVQSWGRGMRAADDQCETFVLDDHIGWFIRKNSRDIPAWFKECYQRVDAVPPAPERLRL